MAVYEWRGIGAKGKNVKGNRDADSPKALRAALRREGIIVTSVVEQTEALKRKRGDINIKLFSRVSTSDLALNTRQLATLLNSGIPLVEALTALLDQVEHEELRSALTQTRDRVNEGVSLADALKHHPKIFSHLFVSMVAAGEASGTLETVLERLADFLSEQARLQSKVSGAIAYPIFMALMGAAVITVMMTVVVPKVTAIFEDFDQSLPWYTSLLIGISSAIVNWWWLILLLLILFVYVFRKWRATSSGRETWDRWLLGMPKVGSLVIKVAISRFARTLATLLSSGVPVLRAMEITRSVLGNTKLMSIIEDARKGVREGESIASTLKRHAIFPPIVTHMIAIGERSGQLEQMLEHVADAYDMQVESELNAMTSLLEPLLIAVMGGAAGAIAVSILMPLLKINEFVQ